MSPMGPINGKPPVEPPLSEEDIEEAEASVLLDNDDESISEVHHVERVSVGEGASRLKNIIVLGLCLLGILMVTIRLLTHTPPPEY